jgi:hypothetical protein
MNPWVAKVIILLAASVMVAIRASWATAPWDPRGEEPQGEAGDCPLDDGVARLLPPTDLDRYAGACFRGLCTSPGPASRGHGVPHARVVALLPIARGPRR